MTTRKLYEITDPQINMFVKGPKTGQPKTLKDRVIRFLIKGLNRKEYESASRKYRMFSGRNADSFLWVGNNGSVRIGKTSSNSFSMTEKYHNLMMVWEGLNDK